MIILRRQSFATVRFLSNQSIFAKYSTESKSRQLSDFALSSEIRRPFKARREAAIFDIFQTQLPKGGKMKNENASQKPHWASDLDIIVAGAGPASLSFARAMHQNWPSNIDSDRSPPPKIRIYERETLAASTSAAREGYSLSIRSDRASGGMQALAKLGLLERMLSRSITGAQRQDTEAEEGTFALWDARSGWKELFRVQLGPEGPPDGLPASHMRIARNVLRETLIEGLPEGVAVNWGVSVVGVERLVVGDGIEKQRLKVTLSDGATEECDILIAADGANSKLRRLLKPNDCGLDFAGAVCIAGTARFADGEIPKPMDRDWGFVLGSAEGTGLFVSPIDTKSAVWCLSYRTEAPREAMRPTSPKPVDDLLREASERGRSFAEPFQTLIQATDSESLMLFPAKDRMAFHHGFGNEKNGPALPVIFIGDANHAVSPFAGNGANMALMDGVELAERICQASELNEAVREYDEASVPRSRRAVQISRWVIDIAHAKGWRLWAYLVLIKVIRWFMMRG